MTDTLHFLQGKTPEALLREMMAIIQTHHNINIDLLCGSLDLDTFWRQLPGHIYVWGRLAEERFGGGWGRLMVAFAQCTLSGPLPDITQTLSHYIDDILAPLTYNHTRVVYHRTIKV